MNSKLEQMKSASKCNLDEAMNTPQATFVLDSNWKAVIAQLTLLTQAVEQVSEKASQTMTAEQMNYHLENQQVIFDQVKSECRHIQQTTAEQTTNSLTSLISQSEKLSLQAGRMEAQNAIENAQVGCDFSVGAVDIVAGIADVASIIDESEEDEDIERHSDSKILAEEIRRKEALGMHMG